MKTGLCLSALLLMFCVETASAKMMTDQERRRAQAEHVCYDDVQRLCNSDIPNEGKIQACMRAKRAKLSAACRKVFDASM